MPLEARFQRLQRRDAGRLRAVVHARSDVPLSGACGPAEWPSEKSACSRSRSGLLWSRQPASSHPIAAARLTRRKRRKEGICSLREGDKAPVFSLPTDGGGRVSLSDFKGRKLVLYFYPKADYRGLHQASGGFFGARPRLRQGGNRHPWRVRRSGHPARRLQAQAQPENPARLGRDPQEPEGLWRLGREIDVWAQHSWVSRARPC